MKLGEYEMDDLPVLAEYILCATTLLLSKLDKTEASEFFLMVSSRCSGQGLSADSISSTLEPLLKAVESANGFK